MATAKDPEQRILSLSEATKGTDILGTTLDKAYIIRSDLGYYLRACDLENATGREVKALHPECAGGDHYFAVHIKNTANMSAQVLTLPTNAVGMAGTLFLRAFKLEKKFYDSGSHDRFYILKGNTFRSVKDLSTRDDPQTGELHPNCRGGDFYMATGEYLANSTAPIFIVVKAKKGKFDAFKDLETGERSPNYKKLYKESHDGPYNLHSKCRGGLYYWATKSFDLGTMWYYILKNADKFGSVVVHCTKNLSTDEEGKDLYLHTSITNFLPGGLSHNLKGEWKLLKQFGADKLPKPWKYGEEAKVGYNKETLHSVQHHWDTKMKYQVEHDEQKAGLVDKVFSTSLKQQFSIEASYGGTGHVLDTTITHAENQSKEETTAVKLSGTIEPGGTISIWQYVITLSSENKVVFATPHVQQTDSCDPPDYEPQMQLKPEDMVK